MPDSNLIDQLIDTYHTMNTRIRTIAEDKLLSKGASGVSVDDIVRRMRNDELKYSQGLRERLTGLAMPDIFSDSDAPIIGTEAAEDSTAILIAQFGSAREVTLSFLRDLPETDWDKAETGGKTIRESVTELAANDKRQLVRIMSQLDGAVPA